MVLWAAPRTFCSLSTGLYVLALYKVSGDRQADAWYVDWYGIAPRVLPRCEMDSVMHCSNCGSLFPSQPPMLHRGT